MIAASAADDQAVGIDQMPFLFDLGRLDRPGRLAERLHGWSIPLLCDCADPDAAGARRRRPIRAKARAKSSIPRGFARGKIIPLASRRASGASVQLLDGRCAESPPSSVVTVAPRRRASARCRIDACALNRSSEPRRLRRRAAAIAAASRARAGRAARTGPAARSSVAAGALVDCADEGAQLLALASASRGPPRDSRRWLRATACALLRLAADRRRRGEDPCRSRSSRSGNMPVSTPLAFERGERVERRRRIDLASICSPRRGSRRLGQRSASRSCAASTTPVRQRARRRGVAHRLGGGEAVEGVAAGGATAAERPPAAGWRRRRRSGRPATGQRPSHAAVPGVAASQRQPRIAGSRRDAARRGAHRPSSARHRS